MLTNTAADQRLILCKYSTLHLELLGLESAAGSSENQSRTRLPSAAPIQQCEKILAGEQEIASTRNITDQGSRKARVRRFLQLRLNIPMLIYIEGPTHRDGSDQILIASSEKTKAATFASTSQEADLYNQTTDPSFRALIIRHRHRQLINRPEHIGY